MPTVHEQIYPSTKHPAVAEPVSLKQYSNAVADLAVAYPEATVGGLQHLVVSHFRTLTQAEDYAARINKVKDQLAKLDFPEKQFLLDTLNGLGNG
jgi:hypothetical protein